MEFAKETLFVLEETGFVALKYEDNNKRADPMAWVSFGDPKEVASHTSKKNRTPLAISVVDTQEMVFVTYKNSTSTFDFGLSSLSGLSMRDVKLLISDGATVAAFTNEKIRILSASQNALNLKKSIDHSQVRAAAIAGSSLLVATDELYELIDLTIDSKIPLFPTPSKPLVACISPTEFIVVQGSGSSEPAMGLIVKFTGEASRQPILWEEYPINIVVEGLFIVAQLPSKIVVHSIVTQEVVQEYKTEELWPHESEPSLKRTHSQFITSSENEKRLGTATKVASHTALYHGSTVQWWVPPSPLTAIEKEIVAGSTPDMIGMDLTELDYANMLLALYKLKNSPSMARKAISELPLALMLYIFGDKDTFESFPGLKSHIEELHAMDKSTTHRSLYRSYLEKADIPQEDKKLVEKVMFGLLNDDERVDFLLNAESAEELLKLCETDVLEEYYQKSNSNDKLLELWYQQIPVNPKFAKKLVEYLSNSTDKDLVWTEALRVIKINPEVGVTLFTRKSKCKFDPDEVLETLKKIDGDVAWRIYLKHLVYSRKKKVFAQDLVMVVVTDLIEMLKIPEIAALVRESYTTYRGLDWPKRPYLQFLQSWTNEESEFAKFVDLEIEFATLVKDGTDMTPIIAIIDEHAAELYVERCAVYRKLGLHTQCLDFLIKDITDYVAVLWYCLYDSNGKPLQADVRFDLAKYALKGLLAAEAPTAVVSEHLEKQKTILSIEYVITSIPESTSITPLMEFLKWHLQKCQNQKNMAQLARSLTMGEAKWSAKALRDIQSHKS